MKKPTSLRLRSLIGLCFLLVVGSFTDTKQARGQSNTVQRPLGLVDDIALAKARSDFPVLARRVLPQIAAQKRLAGIVFKSGVGYSATGLRWVDVTADVLAKVRAMPVQAQSLPLSAAQKDAVSKAILALTQLKAATSIGVSFDDFSSRLINVQATVETSLSALPEGALHDAIDKTLQTYVSSLQIWQGIQTLKPLLDRQVQLQRDIVDQQQSLTSSEKLQLEFARQREDEEREQKSLEPLYTKWNEARDQLGEAVKLSLPKN